MIRIFERGKEDFSNMGLGEIRPLSCVVHEEQGGAYEMELEVPMDEAGLYNRVIEGRIIVAPVPTIRTPMVTTLNVTVTEYYKTTGGTYLYSQPNEDLGHYETVNVPAIYEDGFLSPGWEDVLPTVWTIREAYSYEKWIPSGNRRLQTVKAFQRVTVLQKTNATWWLVTTKEGNTGYIKAERLEFFETYSSEPGDEIQGRQIREQPFRIYRVEKNTAGLTIKAWARHVYYDLMGIILKECKPPTANVASVLYAISEAAVVKSHGFSFYTDSVNLLRGCDYTHRNIVEAHLNPDDGVLAKSNLRMVRDNFDVFFLKQYKPIRNSITYAHNMLGVTVDINTDGMFNYVIPVGKKADGTVLYKSSTYPAVGSPRNNTWDDFKAKIIEYDVEVGEEYTTAEAQAELVRLAEQEFEKGLDFPSIQITVDFMQLGDTEEYQQFRDLDRLYLTNRVRVIDEVHGVDFIAEVTEYDFDCITERYTKISVGVTSAKRTIGTVGSYQLPTGGVSGTKLAIGSVSGSRLEHMSVKSAQIGLAAIQTAHVQDAAITSAKIGTAEIATANIAEATINDLTAASVDAVEGTFEGITAGTITSGSIYSGVVDAVKARIGYLIAENLTTDELYARIATIAVAQITAANIESANITWADIENLTAAIANIAIGEIGTADIDWAHIKDLATETAIITEGTAGELYIARLAVTEANIVSLAVGELMVRGDDGRMYTISVDEEGAIITVPSQVMDDDLMDADSVIDEGENIIYGGITAGKLNVQDIFAENATIAALIAANIDVDELFAREATIDSLNAKLLLTDNYITVTNAIAGINSELTANKSYIRLGKLVNSSNVEDYGIAIGKALLLDANGNISRDSTAVQITSDRQTFYQNGVVGMELIDGGITAGHGNFGHTTVGGKWRTTVDSNGTYAVMWVG